MPKSPPTDRQLARQSIPEASRPLTEREKVNRKRYNYRWRRFRDWYAKRNPLCEECLKHGRTTPMRIVDHITPIEQGGARLAVSNVQSLCQSCHNQKTAKDGSK